ncbi:MAG TPA: tetratricopeptide repeat protein [Patescibacteria group bacterium]|nr:tetratricopeptide repeat protein [Patescibacteria group bacterium]
MKNRNTLWSILVVAVIALVALIAWYWSQKNEKKSTSSTNLENSVLGNQSSEVAEKEGTTEPASSNSKSINDLIEAAKTAYLAKDYTKAASLYEEALTKEPKNAQAILGLGNTYRDWGEADLAIQQYQNLISIDKHNVTAYLNLAGVYQDQKQAEKAQTILEQGINNNPGNMTLQNSLDILNLEPSAAEGR